MGQHATNCGCLTCAVLRQKTMTTQDWLRQHRDHGDLAVKNHNHPSGNWHWLVCTCGAKHLTMKGDDDARPQP